MMISTHHRFDSTIIDREDRRVAVIYVKSPPLTGDAWVVRLRAYLEEERTPIADFVLAADTIHIYLFRLKGNQLGELIVTLSSPEMLSEYEPDFTRKMIYERYLLGLIEAWIRDLAYHWKLPNPPGSEQLRTAGFLSCIDGGTTESFRE